MPQITCGWFGEIEIWLAPYARPIIYIHDGVCVWYIHLSLWWLTKLDMDMVSHETHMHKTQHKLNNWTKLQRCGQCFERQLIKNSTVKRFELLRSKSNGLAIHRLNHSATLSVKPTHGFEPQIFPSQGRCIATAPHRPIALLYRLALNKIMY